MWDGLGLQDGHETHLRSDDKCLPWVRERKRRMFRRQRYDAALRLVGGVRSMRGKHRLYDGGETHLRSDDKCLPRVRERNG